MHLVVQSSFGNFLLRCCLIDLHAIVSFGLERIGNSEWVSLKSYILGPKIDVVDSYYLDDWIWSFGLPRTDHIQGPSMTRFQI